MRQRKKPVRINIEKADLSALLNYLGLRITAAMSDKLLAEAVKNSWSHLKFLEMLAEREAAAKQERSMAARVAQAGFPLQKTIEAFDFAFPRKIPTDKILGAMSLKFIDACEGFIFLGDPGTGKTHLAIAIAYAACMAGYRVKFASAIDMINDLQTVPPGQSLRKMLDDYRRPELLIIDEVGYLPFDERGGNLFFQVISARHGTGATILTTNLPFAQWPRIFGNNNTVTTAIVDRLSQYTDLIQIEGDSYRPHKRGRSKDKTV